MNKHAPILNLVQTFQLSIAINTKAFKEQSFPEDISIQDILQNWHKEWESSGIIFMFTRTTVHLLFNLFWAVTPSQFQAL